MNKQIKWAKDAKRYVDRSEHKDTFYAVLDQFKAKLNSNEHLEVMIWYEPFIYIEVRNTRWKHYPCYMRALVSWDASNGLFDSSTSKNKYAFARKGWRPFINRLVGHRVAEYSDCGNPNKTNGC